MNITKKRDPKEYPDPLKNEQATYKIQNFLILCTAYDFLSNFGINHSRSGYSKACKVCVQNSAIQRVKCLGKIENNSYAEIIYLNRLHSTADEQFIVKHPLLKRQSETLTEHWIITLSLKYSLTA